MNSVLGIGIYIRLSIEDGDLSGEKKESNSVQSQRALLYQYIQSKEEFTSLPVTEYCDDGYSGVNFKRPAVTQLLQDVSQGLLACVIVKDFSRFGRNYIAVGRYLENFFPSQGVRFISINDGYDSNQKKHSVIETGILHLAYGLYSRDISKKVKQGKKIAGEKGSFTGSIPPYGYQKEKRRLVIDPYAATVVKEIFYQKAQGISSQKIAVSLNDRGIETPLEYFQKQGLWKKRQSNPMLWWDSAAIMRIIRNPCYVGTMVSHKSEVLDLRQNRTLVPEENRSVVEHTHEPIVDMVLFQQANMAAKNSRGQSCQTPLTPLSRKVYCGCCHRKMTKKTGKKGQVTYRCRYAFLSSRSPCSREVFTEEALLYRVETALYVLEMGFDWEEFIIKEQDWYQREMALGQKAYGQIQKDKECCVQKISIWVERFCENKIGEEKLQKEKKKVQSQWDQYLQEEKEWEKILRSLEKRKNLLEKETLAREWKDTNLVDLLIQKIMTGAENRMEIFFSCQDIFE